MQKKLSFLLATLLFMLAVSAQETIREKAPAATDSLAIVQEDPDSTGAHDVPASYALASFEAGNNLFSQHNKQLNTKQSSTSQLVFTPVIGYFHKSGFNFSAGAGMLNQPKKGFGVSQFFVTPGYELPDNENWGFGITYSHYFVRDKYSTYASPVQNDLYAYVLYKKKWLEPGIALGYATGKFTEIFKGKNGNNIQLTDTGTYSIRSFSAIASVSHDFEWDGLLSANDALAVTPSLQLNFSSDSTRSLSRTIAPNFLSSLKKERKFSRLQGTNQFKASSVGFNLELNYTIGKFSVSPLLYLDYYLPSTTENRFTKLYSITLAYKF